MGFILTFLPQLGIISADIAHDIPAPGGDPTFHIMPYMARLMTIVIMSIIAWVQRQYERCGELDVAARDTLRRRCYLWLFYTFPQSRSWVKGSCYALWRHHLCLSANHYLAVLLAQSNEGSARGLLSHLLMRRTSMVHRLALRPGWKSVLESLLHT